MIRGCFRSTLAIATFVCFLLVVQFHPASAKAPPSGTCETLPSTIHITKEEYTDGGILSRSCEGDVDVAKCEGSCSSQVQPSVVHPSGFLKECMCCRESFLRERTVTLTHCYDASGTRLTGRSATMDVKLREPAECKCFRCGGESPHD